MIKKIETNILSIMLVEAVFLLLFFKYSFFNIILGILGGILLVSLTKKIKKNKVTRTILIMTSAIMYTILLYKTSIFISYNLLKHYPNILIILSLTIISIYLANKKYHVFIKTIDIIFYLLIIIKVISMILTFPLIDINNFKLDLSCNYNFLYISFFILYLYKSIYYLSGQHVNNKKILLSFINPIIIKLTSLMIIGNKLSNLYQYPYVSFLKRINYFDFIERMEGILSFEYLFCFIITLCFFLFCIKKSQ